MHPDDSPQRLFLLRVEGFFSENVVVSVRQVNLTILTRQVSGEVELV